MKKVNVLYISGSLGLGHITRDIAIARYLRRLLPEVDIEWLAANPATMMLNEAGEKLVTGVPFLHSPQAFQMPERTLN